MLSHRHRLPGGAVAVPRAPAAQGSMRNENRRCPSRVGVQAPAPVCGWLLVPAHRWGKPLVRALRVTATLGFPLAARFSVLPSLKSTLLAWLVARANTKRVVK